MIARVLASLAVSAACIFFATRNVDWPGLRGILADARLFPVLLGMALSLITYWLRAVRWRVLLSPFQRIPDFTLLRWQVGGLLISNLLPLRLGEFARAYWAGHKSSLSKSTVFATIVVERVMDVGFLAVIAAAVLLWPGGNSGEAFAARKLIAVLVFLAAGAAAARFLLTRPQGTAVLERFRSSLPEKAGALLEKFTTGFRVFRNRREFAKVAVLSPVIWSIDIAILALVSRALGLDLSWREGAMTMVGLILGVMVPAAPGSAGTYEAGGVAALTLMGFDKTLSLSFVLLVHAIQLVYVIALGVPILMYEGFSPRALLREARAERG
ncbi:MAG: hypothetical protein A2902_01390 [Elusimicrobia bacterium RIFCSPLOWO2_01_FULL_64_13]|nr:MAG: hypothetical protein A2636_00355 [Elusimicrobia bacterium RIFCSPHIGHO2_01_FULL_64_10]OGR97541.1 MAG: hypothetical protein A2902_01390 [Elusimicrobia bacterium RIFCSPLOWO2_01_FULL_64_13]